MFHPFGTKKKPAPAKVPATAVVQEGLSSFFKLPLGLAHKDLQELKDECEEGKDLFESFNQNRIELAFGSFDLPMKQALFEILYLLHVNNPSLQEWKFQASRKDQHGEYKVERTIDLYQPDCPAGVLGIEALPPAFREEFAEWILEVYGEEHSLPRAKNPSIVGVFSIGSIGTIGHKHLASDLDLEVLYRVEPLFFSPQKLRDQDLKAILLNEVKQQIYQAKKKAKLNHLTLNDLQNEKIAQYIMGQLQAHFPLLFHHLLKKDRNLWAEYQKKGDPKLHHAVLHEVMTLLKGHRHHNRKAHLQAEQLLVQRIQLIQDYVQEKYPSAEIYLFPLSETKMVKGHFSSTLTSKESSGSAYEKILNYDTLMPGIYFNGCIPSHFLFRQEINNSKKIVKLLDYIRFGLLEEVYHKIKPKLAHQGAVPDLSHEYVAEHYSAIYWEAFKASYGNLPKAFLNLLRYEMLLQKGVNKTVIQLIKEPTALDHLGQEFERTEQEQTPDPLAAKWEVGPFSSKGVIALEKRYPNLQYDPWWLRYKALKIAYSRNDLIHGLNPKDFIEHSTLIDLCFALHIRLSDAFGYSKEKESFREHVLTDFLQSVYPTESSNRRLLETIFQGEVTEIKAMERRMRIAFKAAIKRVLSKTGHNLQDAEGTKSAEMKIWFHYYEMSFEHHKEEIPKGILSHLQTPRGQVQVGFEKKEGWFFKSIQRKLAPMGGTPSQKMEQITLIERCEFLWGLAYCVKNGFYGIVDKGSLKEQRTTLALVGSKLSLPEKIDNSLAFVNPSQIEGIMLNFESFFPSQRPNYKAVLDEKERVTEVFILLNLLQVGRIDFLYRDNLGVLRLDKRLCPTVRKEAQNYRNEYESLLRNLELQKQIYDFFQSKNIQPWFLRIVVWVNPNAFETSHSMSHPEKKLDYLNHDFYKMILEIGDFNPLASFQMDLPNDHLDMVAVLKIALVGCLLLATDHNIPDVDFSTCRGFMVVQWKEKWGDLDEGFTQVMNELGYILELKSQVQNKIHNLTQDLNLQLSQFQKEVLLVFLRHLYQSDPTNREIKKEIYRQFEEALSLQ